MGDNVHALLRLAPHRFLRQLEGVVWPPVVPQRATAVPGSRLSNAWRQ
jgi:hypothetical protein